MTPNESKQGSSSEKLFLSEGFNLPKVEAEVIAFWKAEKVFERTLEKTREGKPFTFYDGPPFATGLPHYGHILASTIKDVIPRYHTMRGRFVRRKWGWDCHGLPIEEIVERKLGISGKKQIEEIGIKTFNETCRSTVLQYADDWGKMVERIARWTEFDNSYKTMDTDYMESVWWAFKKLYEKELVYEGRKVLLYCPRCETPISNFEVAMDNSYKEVTEEAVTVKFRIVNSDKRIVVSNDKPVYVLAWTTTPWTLPGNVALAVGENIVYVVVELDGENFVLAKERLATIAPSANAIREVLGKELIGLEYEPLFDVPALRPDSGQAGQSGKPYRIYAADFVTTEEGTGVVHTAVVYGEDDYQLGLREGLPIVPLLDEKGKFNEQAPEFIRGQYFKETEKFIKKDLESRGLLLSRKMHQHSYPHCWRCGNVLFYNAIPAWFINIQKIKPNLLASNEKEISWYPDHLKHGRYQKSVEAAPDWNISRNRYWGNPIPAWKCEGCSAREVVGSLEELAVKIGKSKNNYLVMRHGEAEGNVRNIIDSGDQNFSLTERGVAQAKESAEKLKSKAIDIIFVSDVHRTRQTADIVAEVLGVKEVIVDNRIHEAQAGDLSGKSVQEYLDRYPTYQERFEQKIGGAECARDIRTRVWDFLRDIEGRYEGKNILIVSHEDTLWMLAQSALGWSEERAIEEKKRNDGVFISFAEVRELELKKIPRNDTGAADMHRPYIDEVMFPCGSCGKTMRRTSEIFDSWVEAGSMPFAEYHYPFENKEEFEGRLPAQFVAEYIAQTRAWFYVMHVLSVILFGKAPFENVVTTGTILAEDGSKMSKSKNNFPNPWEVIEKYGVDSLRFYLMNSVVMQADNLNFSVKDLESAHRKNVLILWNVYNYFDTYAKEAGWKFDVSAKVELAPLDKWINARTTELVNGVTGYLDAYDTVHATRLIEKYIDDLSTWYLRRSRGRTDQAFFVTLYSSLITLSKVIAPFMPYLSEVIYKNLIDSFGEKKDELSVHLADWPGLVGVSAEEQTILVAMGKIRELASAGLALRKKINIPVRQPLSLITVKEEDASLTAELLEILKEEVNVRSVAFDKNITEVVELDTKITKELEIEGLARNLERAVQEMRKTNGLSVGEMMSLVYASDDEDVEKALALFDKKKTYVGEIKKERISGDVSEVGGKKVSLRLEK